MDVIVARLALDAYAGDPLWGSGTSGVALPFADGYYGPASRYAARGVVTSDGARRRDRCSLAPLS